MPSRSDTLDTVSVETALSTQREKDPDSEFGGTDARKALERRLLLKIDLRMSVLVVIYILNYIDRTTASNARLKDFEADLGLKGQQFATLLSILYVGYTLMQVPSNMFMSHIARPSIYLCICMALWGVVTCLTGITTNFVGALLTQFFLGFIQAAFFPGALFLLTKWYKQKELGLRTAMLFCGNIISVSFGSLIASGILDTFQGKLGRAGWRWLFFIEGAITVSVALAAIFVLPDFPATDRYLTPQERALAIRRIEEDMGVIEGVDGSTTNGLRLAFTDWKVWWLGLALTLQVIAISFNAYFPTITATLGYNPTVSLLLVAPPFIFATFTSFLISWHSDKVGERFYHFTFSMALGIVGFIISISTMQIAARYIAMFFMTQTYAAFIVFITWISNSISPSSKRAVALALINTFSQLGNISGSYIWPTNWGPTYRNSYIICIIGSSLCIAMCWWFRRCLILLNSELDKAGEGGFKKGFRYML